MKEVLELFKCVVVEPNQILGKPFYYEGLVLDFVPTQEQFDVIAEVHKPLDITTLFTVEERLNSSPEDLIRTQLLHYIEVNVLDTPGLFDLEVTKGKILNLTYIKAITHNELRHKVDALLYHNAPIKDADKIAKIIREYKIPYELGKIVNNELKCVLYTPCDDVFSNGDDAVRWMCWKATGSALLIKSPEVLEDIKNKKEEFTSDFFGEHAIEFANVFNRHKKIILSAKGPHNSSAINHISRLSKKHHKPVYESRAKTFVSRMLGKEMGKHFPTELNSYSLRDKFKILQLLEYKKHRLSTDAFIIRNGKIHIEENRKVYSNLDIKFLRKMVLSSIGYDLKHLETKKILLDPNVDYGLPISRKQTIGHLPFGTRIVFDSDEVSCGIYWENSWGARDLDLSTIDRDGERVGWGQWSGYADKNIIYSGDLVDATNGAMEFMTSNKDMEYGLFVNIYNGETPSECELVIGHKTETDKWINDPIIREKHSLNSKGNVVGFLSKGEFIIWSGRLNNNRVSGGNRALIEKGLTSRFTLKDLLDYCFIEYDETPNKFVDYDHDLRYDNFTFDKLENLFVKEVP